MTYTLYAAKEYHIAAQRIAQHYGFTLTDRPTLSHPHLRYGEDGLHLQLDADEALHVDFTSGAARYRQRFGKDKNSPLAKAIGMREKSPLTILDLTAGLCKDAVTLTTLGHSVTALEQNPVIASLSADALQRADISTITLHHAEAGTWLKKSDAAFDIIYADPMFEQVDSKHAVKKEMHLLRRFLHNEPTQDWHKILTLAKTIATYRVVVKRPRHAPFLADTPADYSIEGSANRYDVYTIRAMRKK